MLTVVCLLAPLLGILRGMKPQVAALYCRISKDRSGRQESVEAQERWGRDYAERTWPDAEVRVFRDNSITAADDSVRAGYDALRAAVAAGEIDHLWAVEQSRLERRVGGSTGNWFQLAAELDAAGIGKLHTKRDGIVPVHDVVAGIKAVVYADEVRKLKARLRDKMDTLAEEGRPMGGRTFGYRSATDDEGRKTLVIEPDEAASLRWAADAILSGWALTRVAQELTRRGHTGRRGGRIDGTAVRNMLMNATVAGLRSYRGDIVGPGVWEPILSKDIWQAVRAKLTTSRTIRVAPDRPGSRRPGGRADGSERTVVTKRRRAARKYILTSGLARCGVCDSELVGSMRTFRNDRRVAYLWCSPRLGGNSCVSIMLERTEQHVVDELLNKLDKPEFLAAVGADDSADRRHELTTALSALDGQRAQLAEMWGAGSLKMDEWVAARSGLDVREQALRAELAAVPAPAGPTSIAEIREAWPEMTLDQQRAELRRYIERVVIHPAKPGTAWFDTGRITIEGPGWETS